MLHHIIAQSVTQSVIQSIESTVSSTQSTAIDVTKNLSQSLRVMGFGMLGIFFIIGIIILLTWVLQKLFPVKKEE